MRCWGIDLASAWGPDRERPPMADSAVRVRKFSCLGESLSESRRPSPLGLPIVDADVEATLLHAPKTTAC
jgi:hypothetical protein